MLRRLMRRLLPYIVEASGAGEELRRHVRLWESEFMACDAPPMKALYAARYCAYSKSCDILGIPATRKEG